MNLLDIVIPVALLTPLVLLGLGIRRSRKIINGTKEEQVIEIRRGDKIVDVIHRNQKIRMTEAQKEAWDQLSRFQKTNFLKNSCKAYKVKR